MEDTVPIHLSNIWNNEFSGILQRIMDDIIEEERLQATILYLDNIKICGKDQNKHDVNLKHFLEAASWYQIMYNESRCVFPLENCNSWFHHWGRGDQASSRAYVPSPGITCS